MKVTKKLKGWLVDNGHASSDASDDALKAAATDAVIGGALGAEKLAELSQDNDVNPMEELADSIKSALAPVVEVVNKQAEQIQDLQKQVTGDDEGDDNDADEKAAQPKAVKADDTGVIKEFSHNDVRVKGAWESYSDTKSAAYYGERHKNAFLRGKAATFGGRHLDHSSQLDKAIAGAWFKYAVNSSANGHNVPRALRLTDHDHDLVKYAMHNMAWTGIINGSGSEDSGAIKVDERKLRDHEIKALIDDSTSGGLEVAPIVFDDAIILTPVLHGELFPLVNTINISRGRRVEGASIGNPTFTSGTAEGTAIDLFDTSSFVSAFDTTIFNAVGAMEIGMDLEEDSPVNLGQIVAQAYGEKAMEWLDTQIAGGDGTTEPEGIVTASGTTTVSSSNGSSGPPTVDDYEGLIFSVGKEYRPAADRARCVFVGTDTSYRRARAISVGSSDARRVLGMEQNTHADYNVLGYDYKVNSGLGNANILFANLKHYRMYRRLGLNIRVETGGKELARKNQSLVVVRMRYGGKLEQGGAAAKIADAQS